MQFDKLKTSMSLGSECDLPHVPENENDLLGCIRVPEHVPREPKSTSHFAHICFFINEFKHTKGGK